MIFNLHKITRKRLLLSSCTFLFGFIAFESCLQVLEYPHFPKKHSEPNNRFRHFFHDGKYLFHVNGLSQEITFVYESNPRGYFGSSNEIIHQTNSLGFRGHEFKKTNDTNSIRIAFLGDSFTFGEGVKFEDTYPQQLQTALNASSQKKQYECLNFGVGGYNTVNELYIFKRIVLKGQPDIVVLGFTLNDAEPMLFFMNERVKHPTDPNKILLDKRNNKAESMQANFQPPAHWPYQSKIIQLFWRSIQKKKINQQMSNYYNNLYQPSSPSWQHNQKALIEIIEICKKRKITCYVLCFPLLYQLQNYPFKDIHRQVQSLCQKADTPFIDVLPKLQNMKAEDLWVHPTDQHPNEIVHKITAELLFKSLKK